MYPHFELAAFDLGLVGGVVAAAIARGKGMSLGTGFLIGFVGTALRSSRSASRSLASRRHADRHGPARVDRLADFRAAQPEPQVQLEREVAGGLAAQRHGEPRRVGVGIDGIGARRAGDA